MEIRSLSHVALLVKDVERSVHFYSQILGMENLARPSSHFQSSGAWLRKGTAEIHLINDAEPERVAQIYSDYSQNEQSRGYCPHIAFEVTNLKQALAHLRSHDIKIAGGPYLRADGSRLIYIHDPDGYVLELLVCNEKSNGK